MSEERIVGEAQFGALRGHHVHRVVQHHVRKLARRFAHEHACPGLPAHQHGQRSDVVLMRVGEDDDVRAIVRDHAEVGERIVAGPARVHARIEQDFFPVDFEEVTIGADLGAAREVDETHGRPLWRNGRK